MLTSSQLQTLLTQFQAHYPMGCLCAELLTIHQGQYIVRSVVQSAGMTLATAMAAAANVEAAEDHAKIRVLEAIGLTSKTTLPLDNVSSVAVQSLVPKLGPDGLQSINQKASASSSIQSDTPHVDKQPDDRFGSSIVGGSQTAGLVGVKEADLDQTSALPEEFATSYSASRPPVSEAASSPADAIDRLAFRAEVPSLTETNSAVSAAASFATTPASSTPESSTAVDFPKPDTSKPPKSEKLSKRKAESFEISPPSASREQGDRSEEIMKIGIEMKRLGWSTEQGREYLKRTYGKRSRQELDDAELLDFLHYLELQPSPLQTPF